MDQNQTQQDTGATNVNEETESTKGKEEQQQRLENLKEPTMDQNQTQHDTGATNVNEVKKSTKGKIFNDPIHGTIEMHPACISIIDTPQFQRLRHIKQLDTCYLVYPGASHNRFEHSIGVSYLAGKLLRSIRQHQPNEPITDRDVLCVEIAGLCHDLGRGPFSYVFEKMFMKEKRANYKHRNTAKRMFLHMLAVDDFALKKKIQGDIASCNTPDFTQFDDEDFDFITELIDQPKDIVRQPWPHKGRDESKSYMYEIVANKRNGIDVDKWDYLARDSYMLGVKTNFDYNRCFATARVLVSNGLTGDDETGDNESREGSNASQRGEVLPIVPRKQICYREKEAQGLYDMFYTKMVLTRQAYQHKTHTVIRTMILDVLKMADESIKFNGKRISETVDDPVAFTQLTDDIILLILYPPTGFVMTSLYQTEWGDEHGNVDRVEQIRAEKRIKRDLQEAKKVMTDILKRKLYKCVGQTQIKRGKVDEQAFKEQLLTIMTQHRNEPIEVDLFHCYFMNLHYGENSKDPLRKIRFYGKADINRAISLEKNQVSFVLPATFAEQIIRIYTKVPDTDPRFKQIGQAFTKWCKDNDCPEPKYSYEQSRDEVNQQDQVLYERPQE